MITHKLVDDNPTPALTVEQKYEKLHNYLADCIVNMKAVVENQSLSDLKLEIELAECILKKTK